MYNKPKSLADCLAEVLSDVVVFYTTAQGYHWNVKGKDFVEFHDFFGEVYEDAISSVDPLAENILKIGYDAPFTLNDFLSRTSCTQEPVRSGDPIRMTASLLEMNKKVIHCLNEAFKCASDCNEQGVADFLAGRIDMHKKWQWQLTAITGNNVARDDAANVIVIEQEAPHHENDDLVFLDDFGPMGDGFFASAADRTRELTLPTNVEAELRALVEDHNSKAKDGLKTTFAKCKSVYRRGARKYSGEMAEGTTRHQFALKRVVNFLAQINSTKVVKEFSSEDADLLPTAHPKAMSSDTITASAAVAEALTVTVKTPKEYADVNEAVLDFAEFSGKGYEAVEGIKDAWLFGIANGKSGYNAALAFALDKLER